MYSDCKTNLAYAATGKRGVLVLLVSVIASAQLTAQNVTSPYSILGIGDIETKNAGRYFISGNTAISRRDPWAYNFSNPASLTGLPLKTMHFDLLIRGKISSFSFPDDDTATTPSKDLILRRISLAFKVTEKTGFAFGLQPYSTVNYKLNQNRVQLDNSTVYDKAVEGSGGLNQVYFSAGHVLGQQISAGITASYLFGSVQEDTRYYSSYMDITRKRSDSYSGLLVQGGLQFYSKPGTRWNHVLGLTGSVGSKLNGQLSTEYSENSVVINKSLDDGSEFRLPLSAGVGYSATSPAGITLSIEGGYSHWTYQKVNYQNSYTYPTYKGGIGMEYSFKDARTHTWERGFLGIGLNAENSYIRIEKQKLWDYSLSLGGGLNVSNNLSVYSGLELGQKGNKTNGQIRENYTQIVLGLTLKDLWLGTKKYGRYRD
ncbi:MAG: hypothetical protein ABWZ25_12785 [Chitinophagaceae bacterium]